MSLLAVPIIAVTALLLVVVIGVVLYLQVHQQKKKIALMLSQLQANDMQLSEVQLANNQTQLEVNSLTKLIEQKDLENVQVSKQLEHRIKGLQGQLQEQQSLLAQAQQNDSQDKFYTRGFKLAEKGAGIEEIMQECELPRAEVEMLLSIYKQRSQAKS